MTRFPQSPKKTHRVSEILTDRGSNLGRLMKQAAILMQAEHQIARILDPRLAGTFQVAALRGNRLILVTPTAAQATQFRLQAPELVEHLRSSGFPAVEHIDIRVAPLARQEEVTRRKRALSPAAEQAFSLMNQVQAEKEENDPSTDADGGS